MTHAQIGNILRRFSASTFDLDYSPLQIFVMDPYYTHCRGERNSTYCRSVQLIVEISSRNREDMIAALALCASNQ